MRCPHCGHEIPTPDYVAPNNGPRSFFIPFDVTGCAPAPNYNWPWSNTVCAAGNALAEQPVNITYFARGFICKFGNSMSGIRIIRRAACSLSREEPLTDLSNFRSWNSQIYTS